MEISVIIPVYNTAAFLRDCLDSVLAQTFKDYEIIIVDDGSTDGSIEICQEYAQKYPFIRVILQDHCFQGTARNRGLREAIGKYIYFMDSDDMIRPNLFERARSFCERMGLDFLMFDAEGMIDDPSDTELYIPDDIYDRRILGIEDRIYTGPDFWNSFYVHHGLLYVCWLLFIRRDYLLKNDIRFEENTYFEDNDWIVRMYMSAERIYYLPEQLHIHRYRRGSNMLSGFTPELLKGCFRMHRVLLDIYDHTPEREKRRMLHEVK